MNNTMRFHQNPISRLLLFSAFCFYLFGCERSSVTRESGNNPDFKTQWLVPEHEVIDGGPGRDGIPSIDNPQFAPVDEIDFIPDDRRILGLKHAGEIRAYPHQILDWHEIVNDEFDGRSITITYCPLSATGIAWIPREGSEFGTSGRLFRNNLVAYDRNTGSLWVQMRMRSVNGSRMGENIIPLNIIETTWETWKKLYPESKVLTTKTGFSRNYQSYAYGEDYAENHEILLFPTYNRKDNRLERKTRVHGIIPSDTLVEQSTARVYEIEKFGDDITVVHDEVEGEEYVVVGSGSFDFVAAYKTELRDGTRLSFQAVRDELPIVMEDQEGNRWDLFGEAVEGPRSGERLRPAKSYSGYWFAFRDMFRLPEIYTFEDQ